MFRLNMNTRILCKNETLPVKNAIAILKRDLSFCLYGRNEANLVLLLHSDNERPEEYTVSVEEDRITVTAGDDLGFVYGILRISSEFLKVRPFWFFMDQKFERKEYENIAEGCYRSKKYRLRYRGWFINDEVLMTNWDYYKDSPEVPWLMAFEALLRCGGNTIIPGTDKNSKIYRKMASDMGLIITHHHAEPLGAEMFARAYPDKNASYSEYPELFRELWKKAVEDQKDIPVIWNVGFRGQGDVPFWEDDPVYSTERARGELISKLIGIQMEEVKKIVKDPIFSTNLYGEVTELYNKGYIDLPESVIKIWADNGFGKMVSRRQGNITLREPALPSSPQGAHGSYYHASFYDLQAAAHITMLPNSVCFVSSELEDAYEKGIRELMIVNCSNIRPHVYILDAIRKFWTGELDENKHPVEFSNDYFCTDIGRLFGEYAKCTPKYGKNEDERAGEQFENYIPRIISSAIMKGEACAEYLRWATDKLEKDMPVEKQTDWFNSTLKPSFKAFSELEARYYQSDISEQDRELAEATLLLQIKIRKKGIEGGMLFADAVKSFFNKDYIRCFILLGKSAERYEDAARAMRESEFGKWEGFYSNECLTDVKFTASVLRGFMSYVRALDDGPEYFRWQRLALYEESDSKIILLTNFENRVSDQAIYEAFIEKENKV